jgi:hypothetical protein
LIVLKYEMIGLQTRYLTVESLVYISGRKSEQWFKKELHTNGALEFIVASGM